MTAINIPIQYNCIFITNVNQATCHRFSKSINLYLIHVGISPAREIRAWWNVSTIFALIQRCLSHRHIQRFLFFLSHAQRSAVSPPTWNNRGLSPSFSSNLFRIFSFLHSHSCSLLHQPPPLCPICLPAVNPPPPPPSPSTPPCTGSLSLSFSCNTNTHTVRTNTHALLMLHRRSQPPSKEYSQTLWKIEQIIEL